MNRAFAIGVFFGMAFSRVMPAQEDPGVQEAIRVERAKDAADARQARIEAGKSIPPTSSQTAAASNEEKPDAGVQRAIAFERAKDAADVRQAHLEARDSSGVASARANVKSHR